MKKDGFKICCHSRAEPVLDPIGDGNPEVVIPMQAGIRNWTGCGIKSGMTKKGMVHAVYRGVVMRYLAYKRR